MTRPSNQRRAAKRHGSAVVVLEYLRTTHPTPRPLGAIVQTVGRRAGAVVDALERLHEEGLAWKTPTGYTATDPPAGTLRAQWIRDAHSDHVRARRALVDANE